MSDNEFQTSIDELRRRLDRYTIRRVDPVEAAQQYLNWNARGLDMKIHVILDTPSYRTVYGRFAEVKYLHRKPYVRDGKLVVRDRGEWREVTAKVIDVDGERSPARYATFHLP